MIRFRAVLIAAFLLMSVVIMLGALGGLILDRATIVPLAVYVAWVAALASCLVRETYRSHCCGLLDVLPAIGTWRPSEPIGNLMKTP
jgi:hypothetical protein